MVGTEVKICQLRSPGTLKTLCSRPNDSAGASATSSAERTSTRVHGTTCSLSWNGGECTARRCESKLRGNVFETANTPNSHILIVAALQLHEASVRI